MDKQLLEILVCPVTGAALERADADRLADLNKRINEKLLKFADGNVVDVNLGAALITRDGRTAYMVDDGIPVMLPEKGIVLD